MYKKTFLLIICFWLTFALHAQDTLRVMVYNLLYYGQFTSFCTQANNNPDTKDAHLRNILGHDLPDIFVVNEMGRDAYYHQRIIDSVLHKISDRVYARAESKNISGSNIMNMMYYNTEKLALKSQHIMQSLTRDIDLYTLYYKSPDLETGDTAFINCIAAHLKAGSSSSDQQTRLFQINNVMAWLASNRAPGNYLFMGDFNAKSSNEQALQNLLFGSNIDFRFYDPVNKLGDWYNNPQFALYHTQSTHTSGSCHAGGGMDDRFDLILASLDIMQGNQMVSYVDNSYTTMGQDGQRLRKSLIDTPTNTSAPYPVIQSLYHNSDHLPVLLSLAVNQAPASINNPANLKRIKIQNPVNHELRVELPVNPMMNEAYGIGIYTIHGKLVADETLHSENTSITIPVGSLKPGIYLLRIYNSQVSQVYKFIKL